MNFFYIHYLFIGRKKGSIFFFFNVKGKNDLLPYLSVFFTRPKKYRIVIRGQYSEKNYSSV